MIRCIAICGIFGLLLPPDDQTLLTWEGRRYTGTVTLAGDEYVVRTLRETRRIAAADVACVFKDPQEIIDRAGRDFDEAKLLYREAKDLAESNPVRNEKLQQAIAKAQGSAKLYRLAAPLYSSVAPAGFGRKLQTIMQFVRLSRGSLSSERAGARAGTAPRVLPLADPRFTFEPPEAERETWVYDGPLGPGQAALAERLVNPDAEKRREAVRLLTHPPAPLHLPELMKILEAETDARVISELAGGMEFFDTAPYVSKLGWIKRAEDPAKRGIAFTIIRNARSRQAFEFLMDWFVESPPSTNEERAAFASAFRLFRDKSGSRLKELLTKHKSRALQTELLMQMGALRDTAMVGMLVSAIPAYPEEAVAALVQIGKPAVPYIMKGFGSGDQRIRKQCLTACRRITGIRRINADHFEKWWAAHRRTVAAEEKNFWADQEAAGFPVSPRVFRAYPKGRKKG